MSKQQTAVDYLIEKLIKLGYLHSENYGQSQVVKKEIEQSKAMEKKQIIDAWHNGYNNQSPMIDEENCGDIYFNETYESKESDDHIVEANEMVESVQKLIDKDIFNQAILAMEEMYGSGCDAEIDAYFRGAKWMQQELNKQV